MRGRIITSDHRIFELPVLLRWNITYTGGVPCDSYEVTCVYEADGGGTGGDHLRPGIRRPAAGQ